MFVFVSVVVDDWESVVEVSAVVVVGSVVGSVVEDDDEGLLWVSSFVVVSTFPSRAS